MTTEPRQLSVTQPVGQALERVKEVLFRPFDAGKWFVIGFCAWLAFLGQGGGGSGFNYNFGGGRGGGWENVRDAFERAREYVVANLAWIVPLAVGLFVIGFAVWVALTWLSSRGHFMFLHCVARNVAEVQVPWNRFAVEANSLFVFRLLVGLASLVTMLPLVVGIVLLIVRMVVAEAVNPVGILVAVGLGLVAAVLGVAFWVVGRLLVDLVVPLQFLRRARCLDAWRDLFRLFRGGLGNVVLYLVFRLLLSMAIGIIIFGLILVTCCIAGCLFALPFLGTVFLLPVLVFVRAYPLYYLSQFGPEWDAYTVPESSPGY